MLAIAMPVKTEDFANGGYREAKMIWMVHIDGLIRASMCRAARSDVHTDGTFEWRVVCN